MRDSNQFEVSEDDEPLGAGGGGVSGGRSKKKGFKSGARSVTSTLCRWGFHFEFTCECALHVRPPPLPPTCRFQDGAQVLTFNADVRSILLLFIT